MENVMRQRGPKTLIPGEPMKRTQVTIDSLTRRKLVVLGDGNLSEGVRKAAESGYETYQVRPEKAKGE